MDAFRDIFGILMGIVIVGGITTLILPGRQTPQVINSLSSGFSGALAVAMGGSPGNFGLSANGIG